MFGKEQSKKPYVQDRIPAEPGWLILTEVERVKSPKISVRKTSIDTVQPRNGYTTVTTGGHWLHVKEPADWILRMLRE